MKMDEHEPCEHCNDEGWIDDPLSSEMGGRWFRYCECPAGVAASEEDHAQRKQKSTIVKAGYRVIEMWMGR
jgi:hypothetical protein